MAGIKWERRERKEIDRKRGREGKAEL